MTLCFIVKVEVLFLVVQQQILDRCINVFEEGPWCTSASPPPPEVKLVVTFELMYTQGDAFLLIIRHFFSDFDVKEKQREMYVKRPKQGKNKWTCIRSLFLYGPFFGHSHLRRNFHYPNAPKNIQSRSSLLELSKGRKKRLFFVSCWTLFSLKSIQNFDQRQRDPWW